MAKKRWAFKLDNADHSVELEHGWWSGKREIIIDGVPWESSTKFFDTGSVHHFKISEVPCVLHIKNKVFTFQYDFYVNGKLMEGCYIT